MSKFVWRMMMLVLFPGLLACRSNKQEEVKEVAQQFMNSLQQQDISHMRTYYPAVDNIDIFYASDTAMITQVIEDNKIYRVDVLSFYLNEESQVEKKTVSLFIKSDSDQRADRSNYYIFDSYGLCSWNSYPHSEFAIHTGCLQESDHLTDQHLVYRLRVAKDLLFYFSKQMYLDLEKNVRITQTMLTKDDDGIAAHGRALVENRSDYTLPDLKYIIVYYDSNNQIVAEDKGWITKTPIESGQTVAFDFIPYYESLVDNADFKIDFDMDLILQFVMDDDIYSGNEYEDFINKKLIDI